MRSDERMRRTFSANRAQGVRRVGRLLDLLADCFDRLLSDPRKGFIERRSRLHRLACFANLFSEVVVIVDRGSDEWARRLRSCSKLGPRRSLNDRRVLSFVLRVVIFENANLQRRAVESSSERSEETILLRTVVDESYQGPILVVWNPGNPMSPENPSPSPVRSGKILSASSA